MDEMAPITECEGVFVNGFVSTAVFPLTDHALLDLKSILKPDPPMTAQFLNCISNRILRILLQAELVVAKAEINRLQQQNTSLLEQLAQASTTTVPTRATTATVSCSHASLRHGNLKRLPNVLTPEREFPPLQNTSRPKRAPSLPIQTVAARTFSPSSTNQGLKYPISLYNVAFLLPIHAPFFDDCISTAVVSSTFITLTVISLPSSFITIMKLKSAPN
ncbi:hypothetical protein G6F18_007831 [Rhizopus arrhizus]|nr:hypothetical protein G6F21_009630 [Rhizopus arrhizus]KAG0810835.1 hypothetical protein G6F20_007644 [Rhizopus arrhizus]KAG0831112.1 hypothetical protein G6F18_007831 [Rhizopus arrhizus]KAG0895720.1 hypothetical protein G6F34_007989 [Rhizopus arrhizus]KAG0909361.1 hypothetical protein G6F33_008857 [Rhizopus arrhizus]